MESPQYKEFTVKFLISKLDDYSDIKIYLPDIDPKMKMIDRKFAFKIFASQYPDEAKQIVDRSHELRIKRDALQDDSTTLQISSDILNLILERLYKASKCHLYFQCLTDHYCFRQIGPIFLSDD